MQGKCQLHRQVIFYIHVSMQNFMHALVYGKKIIHVVILLLIAFCCKFSKSIAIFSHNLRLLNGSVSRRSKWPIIFQISLCNI